MTTHTRIFTLASLFLTMSSAVASCPPESHTRQELIDLKQAGFEIAASERKSLAVALLDCLDDPDPAIRDGVVYEGLATWLRAEQLELTTIDALYVRLLDDLSSNRDPNGFLQPFAALVLSEVARTDRVGGTFTRERREQLVDAAATYIANVNDYRGFSETEGWRHGVAHGADLVLQLVLNEHIDAAQIDRLVSAVFTQVAPAGRTFYIYGEPNRLARAVYYAHARGLVAEDRWMDWLRAVSDPAPLESWNEAYSNQEALARRHNTLGFLMALHVYATASDSDSNKAIDALVMAAVSRIW
ncbi:DUF2785 domain-containing protein [Elongatibacter sediminis]|uniref:DUF2785 domain-containing protein n=1 Tax=Elongatibacter sediminis TaxID=3119006 RepID=A0AAW9R6R6_9GAMM